jgi:hypothetical protein
VREQRSLSTLFDYFALFFTNWRLDRKSGRNGKELDNGQAWTQCSLLDYVRFDTFGLTLFSALGAERLLRRLQLGLLHESV